MIATPANAGGNHGAARAASGRRYDRRVPIRAVVFDLFDTLVDLAMEDLPRVELAGRLVPSTAGALHDVVARRSDISLDRLSTALLAVDREYRETRYAERREFPTLERFTHVVERLGLQEPDLPQALTDAHMGILRGLASTPKHHAHLLDELRLRVLTGICSNFSHAPTALAILQEAGLRDKLDAIAISEDVGFRKPRREIFEKVAGDLGVAPADVLHVGDRLGADVSGASALGMRTAWLTRRVPHPADRMREYEGPRPDFVIADLDEIPRLLDELDGIE